LSRRETEAKRLWRRRPCDGWSCGRSPPTKSRAGAESQAHEYPDPAQPLTASFLNDFLPGSTSRLSPNCYFLWPTFRRSGYRPRSTITSCRNVDSASPPSSRSRAFPMHEFAGKIVFRADRQNTRARVGRCASTLPNEKGLFKPGIGGGCPHAPSRSRDGRTAFWRPAWPFSAPASATSPFVSNRRPITPV